MTRRKGDLQTHLVHAVAKVGVLIVLAAIVLLVVLPRQQSAYGSVPLVEPRTLVWFVMQLHLMFAAFVLGVPIFATIVESIGVATGDSRYDELAREFTRLLTLAFTMTGAIGLLGLSALVILYPKVITYLSGIFTPTFLPYAGAILANALLLGVYYFGWSWLSGPRKWIHLGVGVALNAVGTFLMFIANAWTTFMLSPSGVRSDGGLVSLAEAIQNPLWWPINIHRLIANVAFGGSIAAAYAAVRYLTANSTRERAHYDWMGYVGNFVAMWALIPLPFAGYWLGKEIYAYSAQMGTAMMGGAFSWLFIIQAVLIGVLFIGANYYMWIGLARIPGGHRYYRHVLGMEVLIFVSMAIWMTPHTLVASLAEARRMGGAHHPLLGVFGVMSAKNTVVNLVILTTFVSFVLYRRANKERPVRRPTGGLSAPVFVAALSLFPLLFCAVAGLAGDGARAERALSAAVAAAADSRAVLVGSEATLESAVLGSSATMAVVAAQLRELERAEAEVERLRATEGIHHAAGYRVLAIIFASLLAVALLDMFVLSGRMGDLLQWTILTVSAAIVVYFGVRGYFVDAEVRIGFSVYQVMAVLFAITVITALDLYLFFGARSLGPVQWGRMPARSQYVLLLLGVTYTLTIGLMGFVRSGIRDTWHVYGVLRDVSQQAHAPPMGYASLVVAAATLAFAALLYLVFRLGMRGQDQEHA